MGHANHKQKINHIVDLKNQLTTQKVRQLLVVYGHLGNVHSMGHPLRHHSLKDPLDEPMWSCEQPPVEQNECFTKMFCPIVLSLSFILQQENSKLKMDYDLLKKKYDAAKSKENRPPLARPTWSSHASQTDIPPWADVQWSYVPFYHCYVLILLHVKLNFYIEISGLLRTLTYITVHT